MRKVSSPDSPAAAPPPLPHRDRPAVASRPPKSLPSSARNLRRGLVVTACVALLAGIVVFAWWHRPGSKLRRHRRPVAADLAIPTPPPDAPATPIAAPLLPAAAATPVVAAPQPAATAAPPAPVAAEPPRPIKVDIYPRVPASILEAQIELARRGFSCGSVDGVTGSQTEKALRAFQESQELDPTGRLDPDTRARLLLRTAPLKQIVVDSADLARLQPLSPTWLGKSEQSVLDYATVLELVAERTHAHPNMIRQLNPGFDWDNPAAGATLIVPAVDRVAPRGRAAELHIFLDDHVLQARDGDGGLLLHCPVSIARMAEKRPVGQLEVTVAIRNPNYTFDPEVFPESPEGRELGRKLIIPPGPNNPVGLVWIGLDRPGYGIHGTPNPEQVGRTESHGCFRLANWDARTLLDLARVGLPVIVEP